MSKENKTKILTRVEGHGYVELIRDGKLVVDARLNLYESPRLFESLLIGRRFDEIADIACRICSICSTVHKVVALQAVEKALNITISRQTGLLRELAVQGGQIESHALHVFCLALPDYINVNGFQELATVAPEKLKLGLKIKKIGNLLQEVVGGRAIHPFNLLLGGVGKAPKKEELQTLSQQLTDIADEVTAEITYICTLNDILPHLPISSLIAVCGANPLFGDSLITSKGEKIPADYATIWLKEQVEPHTHAKVSNFDNSTTFMVGPIARILLSMPEVYAALFTDTSIRSSIKARIIELKLSIERAQILIEQLLMDGIENRRPNTIIPVAGEGTAIIEAPRGVLLHSYSFNGVGVCTAANIITPTAINQMAIADSLKKLILAMKDADYDEIKVAAEILIRCYDPCISCAVH